MISEVNIFDISGISLPSILSSQQLIIIITISVLDYCLAITTRAIKDIFKGVEYMLAEQRYLCSDCTYGSD